MDRINTSTKATDLFGAGKHGWINSNLGLGIPATDFNADWCNGVQEELLTIIEGAGLVPDAAVRTQVNKAIKRLAGGNVTTVNAANSPFVLTADHAGLVIMDATGGNISATLPAANALLNSPLRFNFVRFDASVNTVTVNRAGADTFVGATTSFTLSGQGDFRAISSDSTSQWASTAVAATPGVKTGTVFAFAGTTPPTGALACPTAATNISRATYAALFAVIGTTWGVGDGATTFGMPWFPEGYAPVQANSNVGAATVGAVIAHTHTYSTNAVLRSPDGTGGGSVQMSDPGTFNTGSTGGSANLAAGHKVLMCVQY